jgi:hypothetical protein
MVPRQHGCSGRDSKNWGKKCGGGGGVRGIWGIRGAIVVGKPWQSCASEGVDSHWCHYPGIWRQEWVGSLEICRWTSTLWRLLWGLTLCPHNPNVSLWGELYMEECLVGLEQGRREWRHLWDGPGI